MRAMALQGSGVSFERSAWLPVESTTKAATGTIPS